MGVYRDGILVIQNAKWLNDLDSRKDVPLTVTRSQAVARIADRTASQHHWGSRDVISQSRDHLIAHMPFPIGGPLEPSLYL